MASLTTPTVGSIIPSSTATIAVGTAGGAIVEGQPVYVAAAGTIILANADSSGSVTAATVAGLALHGCASGQKIMYVTASPCEDCARIIVNAGISKVVYDVEYRDLTGVNILRSAGIEVVQLSDVLASR